MQRPLAVAVRTFYNLRRPVLQARAFSSLPKAVDEPVPRDTNTTLGAQTPSNSQEAASAILQDPLEARFGSRWYYPIVKGILKIGGYYGKEANYIRHARAVYASITFHINRPEFKDIGLNPSNDSDLFRLATLHIWIYMVRLRVEKDEGTYIIQHLYDDMMHDIQSMILHAPQVKRIFLNKYLSEVQNAFYHAVMSFDEALPSDDYVFANHLWRHIYQERPSVDAITIASLLAYVRRELATLQKEPTEVILKGGHDWTVPTVLALRDFQALMNKGSASR